MAHKFRVKIRCYSLYKMDFSFLHKKAMVIYYDYSLKLKLIPLKLYGLIYKKVLLSKKINNNNKKLRDQCYQQLFPKIFRLSKKVGLFYY